jgi:hypothetical protein
MEFDDTYVNHDAQYSLGVERKSGRYYLSMPWNRGLVLDTAYFELDRDTYERFRTDQGGALEFIARADSGEVKETRDWG